MDFLQLLPQDLVFYHILKSLDFTSRLRAAAVCRAWRRISLAAPPMADMPWIWFTWEDKPTSVKKQYLRNLRATKEDAYGCRGPYLTLLTSEQSTKKKPKYIIYSPFNADIFQLPCTIRDEKGSRHPVKWMVSTQLSSDPPNCMVAALDGDHSLYVCRPGDRDWVKGPKTFQCVSDMLFYKGELYCTDGDEIVAFDIGYVHGNDNDGDSLYARGREVLVHRDEDWCRTNKDGGQYVEEYYLVECGGELLLVVHSDLRKHCYDNKITFTVYRVDQEKGMLVRVDDLGDRMLFVQRGCSQSWSAPEPASDNFFTNNCIYFAAYMYLQKKFRVGKFRLGSSFCEFQSIRGFRPDIQILGTSMYPD